ncbi:hypothetical protein [Bacillus pinisoli]|uniref:hypothetical protein n=1 Tax=Bacillus pinisoli TaxID=2901866 RepID=UPI001FF4F6FC|nr:hypothetical protein [Bacillus pinisoli]
MSLKTIIAILAFMFAFYIQLLGMLNLMPLLLTTPLLFIVLLLIVYSYNNRRRFRGFHRN